MNITQAKNHATRQGQTRFLARCYASLKKPTNDYSDKIIFKQNS